MIYQTFIFGTKVVCSQNRIDKSMSKLLQNSPWKIEITFPAFLYLHGENCLPALLYIIC